MLTCLGIYLSIFAAIIWACIPPLIDKKYVGTAYGIVYCIKNLGTYIYIYIYLIVLCTGPIFMGAIIDSYGYVTLFYCMIVTVSI